jgi:hypothetical protein
MANGTVRHPSRRHAPPSALDILLLTLAAITLLVLMAAVLSSPA